LLAVRALGEAGRGLPARVTPTLRRCLEDRDPAVRAAAVEALAALGDKEASSALVAGAKREPWPLVRRAQIEALGRLCGPGAGDLLARAVERDTLELPDIRRNALRGLFSCRESRATALALEILGRDREMPALRTEAAQWLGRTGDKDVAEELEEILRQLTVDAGADLALEGTTFATLGALATLGGERAMAGALALRADPRPSFRRAAAQALGQLCGGKDKEGERAAAPLRELLRDPDEGVAGAARAALRRCPGAPARSTTTLKAP
jgi:HEAT repeat protein